MIDIDFTIARPLIVIHKDIGSFYPPWWSTPSAVTKPKTLDIFIILNVKNITFSKETLLLIFVSFVLRSDKKPYNSIYTFQADTMFIHNVYLEKADLKNPTHTEEAETDPPFIAKC